MHTVDVVVRSWLNSDGYECEGKTFLWSDHAGLRKQVAGRKINWIRGKNTFAGEPVSEKFFNRMKEGYENDQAGEN